MKLTQTALPIMVARSIVPPPTFHRARVGATGPSPKFAEALGDAPGEPLDPGDSEPDGLADGDGDADPEGTVDGDGDGGGEADGDGDGDAITTDGLGSGDGDGDGEGGGVAGTARITPASTASATRIPATRPARTDSRGPICRTVPVRQPRRGRQTLRHPARRRLGDEQ